MLAGEATHAGLAAGVTWALAARYPWTDPLCTHILERTGAYFHHFSRAELASIIVAHEAFAAAFDPDKIAPQIRRYCLDLPRQPEPEPWLAALALPPLASLGELARFLNLDLGQLEWLADKWRPSAVAAHAWRNAPYGLFHPTGSTDGAHRIETTPLQHYHYQWLEKRSGGWRLIEIPKQRLRHVQHTILRKIIDLVPPHPAAHGFRRAHSCRTHAALHSGQRVVVRMDLKDFFPSIAASRIHALFAKLGYSASVAGALSRLCVNRAPAAAFCDKRNIAWAERQRLRGAHLPQGSPCSPALANLCAFRLDVRLQELATAMDARYSRYADDLVFSGGRELDRSLDRFHVLVAAIALEEGFNVNTRKTRLMRQGVRQQVTGVVVNARPNIPRHEFDALKATLTNCLRHGPLSQNRDGHRDFRSYLTGKVAWVAQLNPAKARRLQVLLAAIGWSDAPSVILSPSSQGIPT